jgi:hypothetical protein
MKIRPVGAELFHADRRTDMTKLIVAFYNFANAPKTVPSNGDWMPVYIQSQHNVMSSNRTNTFPSVQSF